MEKRREVQRVKGKERRRKLDLRLSREGKKGSLDWKLHIGVRSLAFSVFSSFHLVITILPCRLCFSRLHRNPSTHSTVTVFLTRCPEWVGNGEPVDFDVSTRFSCRSSSFSSQTLPAPSRGSASWTKRTKSTSLPKPPSPVLSCARTIREKETVSTLSRSSSG